MARGGLESVTVLRVGTDQRGQSRLRGRPGAGPDEEEERLPGPALRGIGEEEAAPLAGGQIGLGDPQDQGVGPAPEIELAAVHAGTVFPEDKDAKKLRLRDLKGKNVVLYFFPKALTGG